MKKLMVMAFAVVAATVASASNWNWSAYSGKLYGGTMTAPEITSGATAYLFDSTYTQQQLLTLLNTGTSLADAFAEHGVTTAPSTPIGTDAKFDTSADFAYGTGGEFYSFYIAVVADSMTGKVFISDITDPYGAATIDNPTGIYIPSLTNPSSYTYDTPTFGNAGWYTTSAVPEPTSGLLLLLGVAGLALRRRRA